MSMSNLHRKLVQYVKLSEMEDDLDDEEERSRTCDICDKTFTNTQELNNHLPQHHQFQQETGCDRNSQNDLQSFNDPLCMGDTPNQGGQKSNDYQSAATTSDKTNLSSPTTEFSKSKLSLEESKLNSSNKIMRVESEDNLLGTTEEKSTDEEVVHTNVKDEALWDLLEVKMEPEEENVEEFNKDASIPKQKYNKLKKFEGKLFRFDLKSSQNYKKIILQHFQARRL